MSRLIDLVGEKFERLVVVEIVGKNKWGQYKWRCLCDCGEEVVVFGGKLRSGDTKSCGCWNIDRITKHGRSRTRVYRTWQNMIQRCLNPLNKSYADYGGRGITICERWMKFENFLEDMGEQPKGLQIDRTDNNKGYCKSNCRWVTRKEQMRNRRNNILITHKGEEKCLSGWAEKLDINYTTLCKRLKLGWSVEKALTTPIQKQRRKKK